jgi:hypothetical protein
MMLIVPPIIQMIFFGWAISTQPQNIRLASIHAPNDPPRAAWWNGVTPRVGSSRPRSRRTTPSSGCAPASRRRHGGAPGRFDPRLGAGGRRG